MLKSLWWGNLKERDNLEDLDVCGIMILYLHHHICHGVGPLVDPFRESLQRFTMIPSVSWGLVFHYPE